MQRFDRRNLPAIAELMDFFTAIKETLAEAGIYFCATDSKRSGASLPAEENAAVLTACRNRQVEFATGRWCARQVLLAMNMTQVPIPCGQNGAPVWPDGMHGSIAHCTDAWCAVGAFSDRYQSLGVDIELRRRTISDHAVSMYANQDELAWMEALASSSCATHRLSVFSAKESVYKLLYPVSLKPISFDSFSILPFQNNGHFSCRMNEKINDHLISGAVLHGHMFENENLMLRLLQFSFKADD